MSKPLRYVLIAVAFLALVAVAVAVFLCPESTTDDETSPTDAGLFVQSTPIDKTLRMVKLDTEGNELGTFDVHFTGEYFNP